MADSVFYDLAATPQEAANLTARGLIMIAIEQRIKEEGWTQAEAAARLQVVKTEMEARSAEIAVLADATGSASTLLRTDQATLRKLRHADEDARVAKGTGLDAKRERT